MEKTKIVSNKKIYSSNEAIDMVLSSLGLSREGLSTYVEYSYANGTRLRIRLSNHGLFLQNWCDINKSKRAHDLSVPKLNIGQNLAITFSPNEAECKEMKVIFPMKLKNNTRAKTAFGNNVKPQFTVRHIGYYTWKLAEIDIHQIAEALNICIAEGSLYKEPLKDSTKYIEWEDSSNLPPKKIK